MGAGELCCTEEGPTVPTSRRSEVRWCAPIQVQPVAER
jgi:hypothetical protein